MNAGKLLTILLMTILINFTNVFACTTVIISGKYTKDGRPLIWKNRDTPSLNNKLMHFTDGKYSYLALVNSDDEEGSQIWIGFNSAGFAIMNSASYNLNFDDTTSIKDRDGELMKLALQNCATIEDFEKLLKELKKPMGVESNFGVIDAYGGAAYYETGNYKFVKLDVNDPVIAPHGFLIHNNYSFTGKRDLGHGYIRYLTAEELLFEAAGTNDLSYQFILQKMARSLRHSLTNVDLEKFPLVFENEYNFVPFQDFIPRYLSSSSVVIQGIKDGESPLLTTMWTILGFPLCSFTIPVWLTPDGVLPEVLTAIFPENAPLCDFALMLKSECFPVTRGHGDRYLNLTALLNKNGTGILQKILPFEFKIIEEANRLITKWREEEINFEEVEEYYDRVDEIIFPEFKNLFN